jgi:transcriptional regulator GlxA family with amidase domain
MHRETTATSAQLPPVLRKFLDNLQRMRPLPASVAAACRAWHLPRRSLELACRSSSQPSPGALLNHARRQLTQRLLRQGYSPLEIAAEAGFRQTRSLRLKNRPQ